MKSIQTLQLRISNIYYWQTGQEGRDVNTSAALEKDLKHKTSPDQV